MQHHHHTVAKTMVSWKCVSNLLSEQSKKCSDTNADTHLALLQIGTTPLGPGIPNPATLLFNYPTRGIMQIVNRLPLSRDNADDHNKALVKRQTRMYRNNDTPTNYTFFL